MRCWQNVTKESLERPTLTTQPPQKHPARGDYVRMKKIPAAVTVALALAFSLLATTQVAGSAQTAPVARPTYAQGGSPFCTTQREYRRVHRGMRIRRVHRIFDERGIRIRGGSRAFTRSYIACRGPRAGYLIRYRKRTPVSNSRVLRKRTTRRCDLVGCP